jgi:perosamine synthetase
MLQRREIPQFAPYLGEEEIRELIETIRNNWITEGPKTKEFESRIAGIIGVKHAIVVNNGTISLYLALRLLDVGPGDEVIVPDFTFIASANAVTLTGATPVFCDIDPETFNIDVGSAEKTISNRTKAIMPVHIYGQAADMDAVCDLAKSYKLKMVEDAAQGIKVTFKGKHVGRFGDVNCMSFYADKTMTTGEGGAILTDDDILAEKCVILKNQGRPERGRYVHEHIGFNFRLTDLQAAVGVAQLNKLDDIVRRKKHNEKLYRELLAGVPNIEFPYKDPRGYDVPFRVNILVKKPEDLRLYLDSRGIGSRRFFYPLHKQPCYNVNANCPNAIHAYERGLSLPSAAGMSEDDIAYVAQEIRTFLSQ